MIRKFVSIPHPVTGVYWDGTNSEEMREFIGDKSHFLPGTSMLEATYWDERRHAWLNLPDNWWLIRDREKLIPVSATTLLAEFAELPNED